MLKQGFDETRVGPGRTNCRSESTLRVPYNLVHPRVPKINDINMYFFESTMLSISQMRLSLISDIFVQSKG